MNPLSDLRHPLPARALRPGFELLLRCTRAPLRADDVERARILLSGGADWGHVVQTARRHKVRPLLYRGLNEACPAAVPAEVLAALRARFHENARHSLFLTDQLLKLLATLESRGVAAIPLKGPALAVSAYGNLALREFCDLDILVHERDVLRAKEVLVADGYRPRERMDRGQEAEHLRRAHAYTFIRGDAAFEVDLHWRIVERLSPLRLEMDGLWQRAVPLHLGGRSVLGLAPEDVLTLLYVHGCRSGWAELKMVCDLAAFVNSHPELDWDAVIRQASEKGSKRMLFLALLLAGKLSGAALPPDIRQLAEADAPALALAAHVCERLFHEGGDAPGVAESMAFFVGMRERLRDRARYFAWGYWLRPNAKDRRALRLPACLSFLYHFVRPYRLAREHGLSPLGRLLRNLWGF